MAKRKYSREFKMSAVQLVNQQGYSIPQAARSLGIDPANVRLWVAKLTDQASATPEDPAALRAELRRLRQENARLQMERDILKKAAAFFAKEQP